MIISDQHKAVYVGAPKTATTSIHLWLIQNEWGYPWWAKDYPGVDEVRQLWLQHAAPHERQHLCKIPEHVSDYTAWSVIRHPVDRVESLYRHYRNDVKHAPHCQYAEFVQRICNGDDKFERFYAWTQADWLRDTRIDHLLPFRQLQAGGPFVPLCNLPIGPLPRVNVGAERPLTWTHHLKMIVREWAAEDLELLDAALQQETVVETESSRLDQATP
jgi:hypothetical protein